MERRNFLNLTVGFIAGAAALTFAAGAQAAPLPPVSAQPSKLSPGVAAEAAVISQDEIDRIRPVEVRWGHHHHWGHHRHWGWHHRHWGWRHRWHHRHWHHRHWW